jgi:EpsI family protein
MQTTRIAIILATLMCCASVGAVLITPSTAKAIPPKLEQNVPTSFGDWKELPDKVALVSDPATDAMLKELYGEILARTYVNKDGYRIMLSLAWGANQNGNLQAHRPEVCYPAQGFKLLMKKDGEFSTGFGTIDVVRLETAFGARHEPVTYWLTNGNRVVKDAWDKRVVQLLMWLNGTIPDGILFRVSSIDTNPANAFAKQQEFAAELLANVPVALRKRLSGLDAGGPNVASNVPQLGSTQ